MDAQQTAFADAVRHAVETFNQPKHKRKLKDLSPRFWVALLDLELGCEEPDWEKLKAAFGSAYKQLGAPGDFGYGTPCGDALKDLYRRWNELCKARQPADLATPN